jgi:hypothetical protein
MVEIVATMGRYYSAAISHWFEPGQCRLAFGLNRTLNGTLFKRVNYHICTKYYYSRCIEGAD